MTKFVVLEGLDRCGKTTQCDRLFKFFTEEKGLKVEKFEFPNRKTPVGQLIDQILRSNLDVNDQTLHLLFSANRWELAQKIAESDADIILCDRYVWSGVAYSRAKGLDFDWCFGPDIGLPVPHAIIYLDLDSEVCAERKDYGQEKFERVEFQSRVQLAYDEIMIQTPIEFTRIDASQSPDQIYLQILDFLRVKFCEFEI